AIALGGQTLAPLGAARGNHVAPADRLHPRPEAVTALADETAGLIGSLHVQPPSKLAGCIGAKARAVNRKRLPLRGIFRAGAGGERPAALSREGDSQARALRC